MRPKRNRILHAEPASLSGEAGRLFEKAGGLAGSGKKYDNIREMGAEMRIEIEERVCGDAVFSYFSNVRLSGRKLSIAGITLSCRGFEQIDPKTVKGAVVYFINAGDFAMDDRPVMDQLLADMWGTAYTDAARLCFDRFLSENMKRSDSFGPGFYGMEIGSMQKLAKLADPSLVGITVSENGSLLPVKSCAGLFLDVTEGYRPLDSECRECIGNAKSCSLCNVRNKDRIFKCPGNCELCGRCMNSSLEGGADDRKTELLQLPSDFVPEKDEDGYAAAFDIGTTTVLGMLWDIREGKLIGSAAAANPQGRYGADVISRITFAGRKEGNLKLLQELIIECMNDIKGSLCSRHGIDPGEIVRSTICGNTTMSHLVTGHDPASLARAPFEPAYRGTLFYDAKELGLEICPDAPCMVIPGIAGHVGGDITCGIAAVRMLERNDTALFIDIGTNGEIVLRSNGKTFACSTAAGPAFEGAAIYQGMRAADGAVERVRITGEDVEFRVIGDVPPEGICGSGLIDAVSEMLRCGIIDETGRIADAEGFLEEHPGSFLAGRLKEDENGRKFILAAKISGEDIVITQKDIREVQLAKAAIAAGIRIMMKKAGCTEDNLDRVIIAGAFGSYIDSKGAAGIGLIPDIGEERTVSAGNTAGAGCLMAAASSREAVEMKKIPDMVEHVELADEKDFQTLYLREMSF